MIRKVTLVQLVIVVALVALLEALCLAGVIDKITMPPPHRIAIDFAKLMVSGKLWPEIAKSMGNVLLAFAIAYVLGIVIGTSLHAFKVVRDTLDPLFATYYAIPVFAFYPLFIVMFGLGDGPQVLIGILLGIVAVIVTTLNGLDHVPAVLRKTAQVAQLGPFADIAVAPDDASIDLGPGVDDRLVANHARPSDNRALFDLDRLAEPNRTVNLGVGRDFDVIAFDPDAVANLPANRLDLHVPLEDVRVRPNKLLNVTNIAPVTGSNVAVQTVALPK